MSDSLANEWKEGRKVHGDRFDFWNTPNGLRLTLSTKKDILNDLDENDRRWNVRKEEIKIVLHYSEALD